MKYMGFFTKDTEIELVNAYIEILQEVQPDAKVEQDYRGKEPALITFTRADQAMTEFVSAVPLISGTSFLLIAQALPSDMPEQERVTLQNSVSLDLSGAVTGSVNQDTAGPSSAGQAVERENAPVSDSDYEDI